MEEYEKKIKKVLEKEIDTPAKYEFTIKTALKRTQKEKKVPIYKLIATACCSLVLCTGIAFAAQNIYQKVWKEPIYITEEQKQEEISNVKSEITKEETQDFITEDEANEKALAILKKLGYENENITNSTLIRGYGGEIHYLIKTSTSKTITLDPQTSELYNLINNDMDNRELNSDKIDSKKAIELAEQTYKKLGINLADMGYEVCQAVENGYVSGKNSNKMWNVKFAKKHSDRFDMEDYYSITFLVSNEQVYYYAITGNIKGNFEDNPIIITKDEAIKIAEEKEAEFSNLDISDINAELAIKKMNLFVFCLENNITNDDGKYQVDDISRNVWVVKIEHNKNSKPKDGNIDTVKQQYNKAYYIDATTGEVIGGEQIEF